MSSSGLTNEETGNDQRSIDLIDGAAAECYVTSKELRYSRCGGFEVTVRHARAASGHNSALLLPRAAYPLRRSIDLCLSERRTAYRSHCVLAPRCELQHGSTGWNDCIIY
jgi:hypothetical protein